MSSEAGDDLVGIADANMAAAFELLARRPPAGQARTPRRFGGAVAFATGRHGAYFNPVLVVEPVSQADLGAAIEWLRATGSPMSLRVREDLEEDAVRAAAAEAGLQREAWAEIGMVLRPIGRTPPPPTGLSIEAATPATMARFYEANAAGFEVPPDATAQLLDLTPPDLAEDPDICLLGGFLDGEPVACSLAIRSAEVVGVYAVGTASHARRRGIGTAMTWAAVGAGVRWGCRAATLQASEMGESVYRAMGFTRVTAYALYRTPRLPEPPISSSGSLSMSRVEPKRTAREASAGPSTRSSSRSVSSEATET
jgi:GNAT superfamily N-acetyltransferase